MSVATLVLVLLECWLLFVTGINRRTKSTLLFALGSEDNVAAAAVC